MQQFSFPFWSFFFCLLCKGIQRRFGTVCPLAFVALFVVQVTFSGRSSVHRNPGTGSSQGCQTAGFFQSVQEANLSGKKSVWFRKCMHLGSLCVFWKWNSRSKIAVLLKVKSLIRQEWNYFKEKTYKHSGRNGESLTLLWYPLNSVASLFYSLEASFRNRGSCIL